LSATREIVDPIIHTAPPKNLALNVVAIPPKAKAWVKVYAVV
jgi:hypothetical protein